MPTLNIIKTNCGGIGAWQNPLNTPMFGGKKSRKYKKSLRKKLNKKRKTRKYMKKY